MRGDYTMVNVLVIGNGAREHAITEAFSRSSRNPKLFAYMKSNNPGISGLCDSTETGSYSDLDKIKAFSIKNRIDLAFIGPEDPLSNGVSDLMAELGIGSVGPKKILAQLETSKSFTRNLVEKYNIPGNARYKVFSSEDGIREFMEELDGQFVVKADGLKGGKGVKVVGDHLDGISDGFDYCMECIKEDGRVVVEEKFIGQEFSLMSFVDGKTVRDLIPVQDHKRAYVGDEGPNTGGMGSYSDSDHLLPFITSDDLKQAHSITQMVCDAIHKETGEYYKGVMYGGFIATADGVRLIEYNARLGDPEAMNVLPVLKTDMVELSQAIVDGTLDRISLEFEDLATVCKYAVPEAYPDNPVKDDKVEKGDVGAAKLYYASVDKREDGLYMTGSRAIALVGIAPSIPEAEQIAENAVRNIKGRVFHRPDIGTAELIAKRIEHMKQLRP